MYTTYLQKITRRLLAFLCMFVLVGCGKSADHEAMLKTGLALYDQSRYEQAAGVFTALYEEKKAPAETGYYLTMVELALGNLQSAKTYISAFVEAYPNQLDGRVTQAYIYYLDGDREEAKEILDIILVVEPSHEQALLYMSLIDIEQADYYLAEPHLLDLVERFPDRSDYHYLLGSMYSDWGFEAGDAIYTKLGLQYLHAAYKLDTDDRDTQLYIGMSLNDLMYYDKAARVLVSLVQKYPDHVLSMVHLGSSLSGMGRDEQAISAYEQVLTLDPSNVMATLELQKLGQPVEQLAYATQSAGRMSVRELGGRNIRKVWQIPVLVRE